MLAAVAAGESRMIPRSFLFRVSIGARSSTITCLQPKPLPHFQAYKFFHAVSNDLTMSSRKRRVDIGGKGHKNVTQTWKALSTEPICNEAPEAQSSNPEVLTESIGEDACPTSNSSKVDISSDENLVPPENHSISMEVGRSLMRFIKGKGDSTQKKIEAETGVKIMFPSSKTDDFICIEGTSAERVAKASEKIQVIINQAVNSRDLDYSHFISLPLAIHPGLVNKLVEFQNTILGITASDKDENDGGTADEAEQQSSKDSKVVESETEKVDAHVEVNITGDQHSAKAPLVAEHKAEDATNSKVVELEAEKVDAHVQHSAKAPRVAELRAEHSSKASIIAKIANIPLVSYRPKELNVAGSSESRDLGIDKSIFIKPTTFHLTVLMLKLWNKDRVKAAAEILQSVSPKVLDALDSKPLSVRLKGLSCLRGSLDKARVVYAPVEEIGDEGRLLRACQVIRDAFVEAGLVIGRHAQHDLKLHATIMNARHRKRTKWSKNVDSFDARGIFDQYGSEEWGEYPICEAHLSQRFAYDENGYYHCCASIPFPAEMQDD
ncbi:activating signal cointegrator 1 complex subunit [Striga asiatica]|uniref:Activating signal cointegrator 1 complex subunit n=1 Tax=Striga asiatica TaxID=4170 RepID=A0A5A7QTG4_STRAF|nr:activating signal cointegrator 1 complex subunit [Striga asiatica]